MSTSAFRKRKKGVKSKKADPKPRIHKKRPTAKSKGYTFSDILSSTVDELERSLGIVVYKHKDNLSPEQVIFCLEFIKNGYKGVPAIKETFGSLAEQWNDSKCNTLAMELLSMEKVKLFINEQLELRAEKLKTTSDWIAQKYRDWATLSVTDYVTIRYSEKTGRPRIDLTTPLEELPETVRSAIKSIKVTAAGDLSVEFVDQKGALDALSKLMGYMTEKLDVQVKGNVTLNFDAQDATA